MAGDSASCVPDLSHGGTLRKNVAVLSLNSYRCKKRLGVFFVLRRRYLVLRAGRPYCSGGRDALFHTEHSIPCIVNEIRWAGKITCTALRMGRGRTPIPHGRSCSDKSVAKYGPANGSRARLQWGWFRVERQCLSRENRQRLPSG